ncbi:Restriction endonuclease subunit S [Flavobacterium branchiophilum]|uniref:Restriction endonuclease subunit S n=2 Tax=Flavobacterium branchiophilum TaxID=55197 RepID=A0A2H3KRF9_9FLAO|nr:restriction endonuclease subunit S [Flavobacterium branchiophilum]PDS24591.1 restriction endonuclease subunit S [Flavobacterium branchiophilum]CCB68922.1 Probable type I restriction-modification system, DNA specificity domain protein [Flavobacterium branchiophilum FL-15]
MVNSMQQLSYLKLVPLSRFNLWDVKRYTKGLNISFENVVRLRDILIPYKKNVSKEEMIKNKWQIIAKINFGGQLFLRDFEEIHTYKGGLNLVPENAIIYSKINVRHGCIYFNEIGNTPFGVSNEYPTFTFDETLISGDFLRKVLRSNAFKKLLNSKTSGISKARVKQDEFLDIEIPLPTLEEQNRIVASYNAKLQLAQQQEEQAKTLEMDIERYLFEELGVEHKKNSYEKKIGSFMKIYKYSEFDKWGANQNNSNKIISNNSFKLKKIKDICTVSSGGTPSRERKEYYKGNIPWIKTGEVVNDIIYDTEEKITIEAIKNSSAKIYPKDSLIIAMYGQGATRGRTAKLGIDASTNQACAVLFNINNSVILTDYLWLYLMGEYDRMREMASGNNQPNLNAQMLKDYNVIIPPFEIQTKIINTINSFKSQIKELNVLSAKNKEEAIVEFEKEIFN